MAFDPKKIDRLAAKAALLEEQVHALVAELEKLAEQARASAAAEPVHTADPAPIVEAYPAPITPPAPLSEPDPEPIAEPDPEPIPEPIAEPAPAAAFKAPEGARLVALNMALSGKPREETARYLRENFEIEGEDQLLDEVYAKAGS